MSNSQKHDDAAARLTPEGSIEGVDGAGSHYRVEWRSGPEVEWPADQELELPGSMPVGPVQFTDSISGHVYYAQNGPRADEPATDADVMNVRRLLAPMTLILSSTDPEGISGDDLRAIADMWEQHRQTTAMHTLRAVFAMFHGGKRMPPEDDHAISNRIKPDRNYRVTDALLQQVAETYREAVAAGRPPRKEVARVTGRSLSRASQLIRASRDQGLLDEQGGKS